MPRKTLRRTKKQLAELRLVRQLQVRHGYTFIDLPKSQRVAQMTNFKTWKTWPVRCVKLVMPMTSLLATLFNEARKRDERRERPRKRTRK